MRWILPLLIAAGLVPVADVVSAQGFGDRQGPVLIVPGSSADRYREGSSADPYGRVIRRSDVESQWRSGDPDRYGSRYGWQDRDSDYRYGDAHDHDHGHDHGGYRGPLRYSDTRMQQVSDWYRQFLGRNLKPAEEQQWRNHLAQSPPGQEKAHLHLVAATILGSDEYYQRIGGRFSDWTAAVARDTGRPISRDEAIDWNDKYRRARDRVAARIDLAQHLLEGHEMEPIVAPDYRYGDDRSRDSRYRDDRYRDDRYRDGRPPGVSYYGPAQQQLPWYARDTRPDHEHEHGHEHEHEHEHATVPVQGNAESATIAGWYRSYLGRQAKPEELQQWLTARARGMSPEQVRAAIFSSDEWYARTGGSPEQWAIATLGAIGRRGDQGLHAYWLDRYQRHSGDRYKTALEMIQNNGEPDRRSRRDDDD